jgi:regulator of nucleoside diphosphate kinase
VNKIVLSEAQVPKPAVALDAADYDRLLGLAMRGLERSPDVAAVLLEELVRAEVLPSHAVPPNLVTIGSFVTFRYNDTGWSQKIQLVLPEDADISQGRVSVFTPVGAALIGLSEGQQMSWKTRLGETRSLTVLKVIQPG